LLLAYISVEVAWVRPTGQGAEEEVLRLLASLAVFYVALFVSRRAASLRVLVLGLVALGLFEALYGLVQYTSGWQQIFSYKKVFYLAQASGTYINPNHFAGLLEMIVPLPLALALERLERLGRGPHSRARYHSPTSEGVAALVFFLFSALLLLAAILFSRSRAGLACASVTLAALAAWVKVGWQRSTAALATAWVLAGSLLFGLWLGLGPVVSRYGELGRDSQGRIGVWRDTLALVRMHPVLGWGPGTFADAFPRVQSVLLNRTVDHAHNDYLEFAAEWGTLGAVLLFGTVFWVLARAAYSCLHLRYRENRFVQLGCCAGAWALLLHSTVDFNLQIPGNTLVFAALLGMAYAAVYRVSGNTGDR
jgi:O-antigen ligase